MYNEAWNIFLTASFLIGIVGLVVLLIVTIRKNKKRRKKVD